MKIIISDKKCEKTQTIISSKHLSFRKNNEITNTIPHAIYHNKYYHFMHKANTI